MPEDETPKELRQISDEELKQVLEDHLLWVKSFRKEGKQADLSNTDLRGKDFKIEGEEVVNLEEAYLEGTKLDQADLEGAHLDRAHLQGTDLSGAHLDGAYLVGAHLEGARLFDTHLEGAILLETRLGGAKLVRAYLERANLWGVHLEGADLRGAHLEGAFLLGAHLEGAVLRGANLESAEVSGVTYDCKGKYQGIRVATCYGSPMFKRHAQDQDWLEEYLDTRKTWWQKLVKSLWWITSDYGRSIGRWVLVSLGLAILFACIYHFILGPNAFSFNAKNPLPQYGLFTMIYYSVVTFTTLGFGDITPITKTAACFVMSEVILGYVMLGGLISIFATLLARRSGQ